MYLSPRDVARIACVSKDWRDLVDSPSVWREICERYWNIALPRGVKANLDVRAAFLSYFVYFRSTPVSFSCWPGKTPHPAEMIACHALPSLQWKEICRMLVQSRRIFNSDPSVALDVLRSAGLIAADQQSTTRFLLRTRILDRSGMGRLLAAKLVHQQHWADCTRCSQEAVLSQDSLAITRQTPNILPCSHQPGDYDALCAGP